MQTVIPFIVSLLAFILVVSGILGIAVNLFYEGGLIETLLGKIWNLEIHYIITAIPIIVSAIVLGKLWGDSRLHKGAGSLGANFLFLLMMAAGGYFIYLYIATGSLLFHFQSPF
jgi:hypothetical protein